MSFAAEYLTTDGFLDGRLQILQPKSGYRAATDPVYLAAAVPAKTGQSVLELGCGAGVALACLCYRVRGLDGFGLEIQRNYADLARTNLIQNQLSAQIVTGDLLNMPDSLKAKSFDHVLANPPFFKVSAHTAPTDKGRATGRLEGAALATDWVDASLTRLKPGGWMTMIHRAEMLAEILAAIGSRAGDIRILPIAARQNRMARRVIVQARKGAAGVLTLMAPLIVHSGAEHGADGDDYADVTRGILRDVHPLVMTSR
ncbi:MAG: methyltransferase [Rhodobacteraceae bacterium]|nr:methyltransferase [Paracoccaceae bacterium]